MYIRLEDRHRKTLEVSYNIYMAYQLKVVQGDIAEQWVDAVVNAANTSLFGGSGVCGAIFNSAGYDEMTEACRAIGFCETGEAVITPGFKLPAKYVIHTVGPIYGHNDGRDEELLKSAHWSALNRATENSIRSITFPLISTGVYGYPKEEAVKIAVSAIHEYMSEKNDSCIQEITFCAYSNEDYELVKRVLEKRKLVGSGAVEPNVVKIRRVIEKIENILANKDGVSLDYVGSRIVDVTFDASELFEVFPGLEVIAELAADMELPDRKSTLSEMCEDVREEVNRLKVVVEGL